MPDAFRTQKITKKLLDITRVMEVRQAIPVASQRREDIYNTVAVTMPVIAKGS